MQKSLAAPQRGWYGDTQSSEGAFYCHWNLCDGSLSASIASIGAVGLQIFPLSFIVLSCMFSFATTSSFYCHHIVQSSEKRFLKIIFWLNWILWLVVLCFSASSPHVTFSTRCPFCCLIKWLHVDIILNVVSWFNYFHISLIDCHKNVKYTKRMTFLIEH